MTGPDPESARGLIINADDFGLSPGVNRGILSAFRDGVLTSTTMLVNLGFFDEAVAIARDNPDLPVGIHLSLLWGAPVTDPARVASLVRRDGCFPRGAAVLARRYALGRLKPEHVRTELRSQVRKFLESGLTPTHVDTHKHIHSLPGIFDAVIEVAGEFGIGGVRLPWEADLPPGRDLPRAAWKDVAKQRLIRGLLRSGRARLERAGIRTSDHFVGVRYMSRLDAETLEAIVRSVPIGVTEIMCHPGFVDEHLGEFTGRSLRRERELAALKDDRIREIITVRSIRLMDYRDLQERS